MFLIPNPEEGSLTRTTESAKLCYLLSKRNIKNVLLS